MPIFRSNLFMCKSVRGGLLALSVFFTPYSALAGDTFIISDHFVIDISQGLEWRRCSLGQNWDGSQCRGKVGHYSIPMAEEILAEMNESEGTSWRLPTRDELEGLVCESCEIPKIDSEAFPQTSPEPYWTGEVNAYASSHNWSVNFYTGHSYGRFFPNQELAVRPVRSRGLSEDR